VHDSSIQSIGKAAGGLNDSIISQKSQLNSSRVLSAANAMSLVQRLQDRQKAACKSRKGPCRSGTRDHNWPEEEDTPAGAAEKKSPH